MISKIADIGRILGASAIFYFHVGIATRYPLFKWGDFAVSFFIILSGLAHVCFSSVKPDGDGSWIGYVKGKMRGIFPMFVAVNLLIFAASYVYPSALGRPFNVMELLLSSSGLSQYFGFRYLSTVMWFVPFILQAYLFFPWIEKLLNSVPGVVVIIGAFLLSTALNVAVFALVADEKSTEVCRNWCPLFRLPEVCFGVLLGKEIKGRLSASGIVSAGVYAALAVILAVLPFSLPDQSYIQKLPLNGLIMTTLIAVLAVSFTPLLRGTGKLPMLRTLGLAAYPFYLTHGIAILFIFKKAGVSPVVWILYYVACWGGSLLLVHLLRRVQSGGLVPWKISGAVARAGERQRGDG